MANENTPESQANVPETTESFKEILTEFEQSHSRRPKDAGKQLQGTVITVSADSVILDIGFKSEGILPISAFQGAGESVKPGDQVLVSVKGRDPEGYYELTRFRTEQPKDWSSLERAFAEKAAIVGTVSGVIKGGLSVDVGVRAFMPASRPAHAMRPKWKSWSVRRSAAASLSLMLQMKTSLSIDAHSRRKKSAR